MIRKSGMATNRVTDFRIDHAARMGAEAVQAAGNGEAAVRFPTRFLDHLHDVDADARGLRELDFPDPNNSRRRRRRRREN